jgi:hypothetical protein
VCRSLWGTDWIFKYYLEELGLQRVKFLRHGTFRLIGYCCIIIGFEIFLNHIIPIELLCCRSHCNYTFNMAVTCCWSSKYRSWSAVGRMLLCIILFLCLHVENIFQYWRVLFNLNWCSDCFRIPEIFPRTHHAFCIPCHFIVTLQRGMNHTDSNRNLRSITYHAANLLFQPRRIFPCGLKYNSLHRSGYPSFSPY